MILLHMILSSLFCALLFCLVFVSVVTIASEPASIDYDRSFEKKIAMSMSIRCHTGMWTDNFLISANYCTACFCDNQRVETVKFLVCDAVRHIKNKLHSSDRPDPGGAGGSNNETSVAARLACVGGGREQGRVKGTDGRAGE